MKEFLLDKNRLVFSFQANIYCIILCKLLNVNIIVRSNSSPSGWYHNTIKKIIYKYLISKADSVIVNSIEFKKQMESKFKIKVNCIFNPLDLKNIRKIASTGINRISIGRLTHSVSAIDLKLEI